jgi:ribosomal protein S27AE
MPDAEFVRIGGTGNYTWDDELQMHLPCCRRCGNGPLCGDEEVRGICGPCWTHIGSIENGSDRAR